MKLLLIISLIQSLLLVPFSIHGQNFKNENQDPDIRVDPAVELFCIIHRLAKTDQYTTNEYSRYIGEVEDHFGSFQDHPTIIHEFCHSYINPLIDNNYSELKAAAETIFRSEPPKSYFLPNIMLQEYLVRASTIRFFRGKGDIRTIMRRIRIDKTDGFPAIDGLVRLLDEYEGNRNKFVSLLDFMPEIIRYFNTYSAKLKN